jgi:hypothetical protein
MGFLSSKQGDFLEARPAIPRLHPVTAFDVSDQPMLSWAHEVRGARLLSTGANINEPSLQF